jgi:hypothetical protein
MECRCTEDGAKLPKTDGAGGPRCPRCGTAGRPVPDATLRSLLPPEIAASWLTADRWFCPSRSCAVLYFGPGGRVVEKSAAAVRVGLKETEDPVPLCYCFGFTLADVRQEVAQTGRCTLPARIAAAIRKTGCRCEEKNPAGACCLRDVLDAIRAETERRELDAGAGGATQRASRG